MLTKIIDNITKIIEDMVFQSNIHALNAAIHQVNALDKNGLGHWYITNIVTVKQKYVLKY